MKKKKKKRWEMKLKLFELVKVIRNLYDVVSSRKPHVNVGTIGHVDHGKTTLTAAITKV